MYIHTHIYPNLHVYTQIYIYMYTYNLYYTQICMYVYSHSLSLVSLSLSPFSLSRSLALSLSFCLSISFFSRVVSRCVSAGPCHLVSLCVTHAHALVLFFSNLFCLSFSLAFSLLLSHSLFLFFLYTNMYIPKLGSLHATPLVWLHLRQLFGKHFSHQLFALLDTCCCHDSELALLPESLC